MTTQQSEGDKKDIGSLDFYKCHKHDIEGYKHLFIWTGLLHIFKVSTVEECDTDLDIMRQILLDAFIYAKNYTGNNPQLKLGFTHMLETLPEFSKFYPELSELVSNAPKGY